ncbi:Stealth CR1 domain-containing protein [Oenococcus oeni]|uniref:Stealth CR1 domain-containing protein n=1 Tax=Oenococcus oeni TaxID=1247 RepID=UPI00067CE423|nr:Stealth CR1 domain-containing protein [Oenococcus oeni]
MKKNKREKFPIDFVITWVDGSDKKWQNKKLEYIDLIKDRKQNQINRYRDYGLLKNWFERIWEYAPWVRKVFLVTDNQAPKWAYKNDRIVIVDHNDFIPKKYLPTFNSNSIEMNIWRIGDLSEHFVLFNDDMYVTKNVYREDFFNSDGLPILTGSFNPVVPRDNFSKIIFNNMVWINEFYSKKNYFRKNWKKYLSFKYGFALNFRSLLCLPFTNWLGFYEDHLPYPHLKSKFTDLYNKCPKIFEETSSHRFRESDDYSQWLLKNIYLVSGNFYPRKKSLGIVVNLQKKSQLNKFESLIGKHKIVVINDDFVDNSIVAELQRILFLGK